MVPTKILYGAKNTMYYLASATALEYKGNNVLLSIFGGSEKRYQYDYIRAVAEAK